MENRHGTVSKKLTTEHGQVNKSTTINRVSPLPRCDGPYRGNNGEELKIATAWVDSSRDFSRR